MRYNRLIKKYDKKYNEKWIEFVLYIVDNHKSNIELIDFFKNDCLTDEIFKKLEFIIEENDNTIGNYDSRVPSNIVIIYNDIKYRTPFYLDNYEEIEYYAIFNRHFGKKYLIKFLDSLNLQEFIVIFNIDVFDDRIYCPKTNLYKCPHFTPDIILKYMVKLTNKPEKEILKHIDYYITNNSDNNYDSGYFWYNYSKIPHKNIERFINWPWSWKNVLKYAIIDLEFIEKNRDRIVNTLFLNNLSINRNLKIVY